MMTVEDRLSGIWVYLTTTPLLWLAVTLVVYQLAFWSYRRFNAISWLNPVLIAIVLLVALLRATSTPYQAYFDGAQYIHFLLGPATVALAVPLFEQRAMLRQLLVPAIGTLVVGSIAAILLTIGLGKIFGASRLITLSMIPKSVTTPIAMGVAEEIGGIPSLTAVLVILTGVLGAVVSIALLNKARVRQPEIRGFAIGLASHGIGTARAFQEDGKTGAFSGLAMALNGAVTAIVAPILV